MYTLAHLLPCVTVCRAHLIIITTHSRWLKSRLKRAHHLSYHSHMVAEHGCDTPWLGCRERISERIDEQVVDHSRLEAARAGVAEAGKNLATCEGAEGVERCYEGA